MLAFNNRIKKRFMLITIIISSFIYPAGWLGSGLANRDSDKIEKDGFLIIRIFFGGSSSRFESRSFVVTLCLGDGIGQVFSINTECLRF